MKISRRVNIDSSRKLRKNQTDAERILWNTLRNRQICGAKFRRQYPIDKYIMDFYSPEYKLGIEADGGQHYIDDNTQQDELRTNQLAKIGVQILRFSNIDILNNIEGVYEEIERTLTLILSLKKGEGECWDKGQRPIFYDICNAAARRVKK